MVAASSYMEVSSCLCDLSMFRSTIGIETWPPFKLCQKFRNELLDGRRVVAIARITELTELKSTLITYYMYSTFK